MGVPSKKERLKIEAMHNHLERRSTHDWYWSEIRRAVCQRCGLQLLVKMVREPGAGLGKGGWRGRAVWGGNEHGIGGFLKEPPCPRRRET
jgi:hypothetical protein